MRSGLVLSAVLLLGGLVADGREGAVGQSSASVERGRYLVHEVAMCVQCHSPRDRQGNLEYERLLHGGTIPVDAPYPNLLWGFKPPRLAGLPGWETEDIVTLLMTGRRLNGYSPRPPMPPFRLTEEDARAIVSYLRTVR